MSPAPPTGSAIAPVTSTAPSASVAPVTTPAASPPVPGPQLRSAEALGAGDLCFVVGTGRCGSTLVQELVARHDRAGFVSNVDDRIPGVGRRLTSVAPEVYRRLPSSFTAKGRVRFAPSEAYLALAREVSPTVVDPASDLTSADVTPWLVERTVTFFRRRADALDDRMLVAKLTGWPRLALLEAIVAEGRYVHVVRDPRAVVNSLLQMSWWGAHRGPTGWALAPLDEAEQHAWDRHGRSIPALTAIGVRRLLDAYAGASAAVGASRWLDIRYEDLVAAPTEVLASALAHVGLELDDAFAAQLERVPIRGGRLRADLSDLTDAQRGAVTDVLAGALDRWGYDAG